jgi:hypothetical protein
LREKDETILILQSRVQ